MCRFGNFGMLSEEPRAYSRFTAPQGLPIVAPSKSLVRAAGLSISG